MATLTHDTLGGIPRTTVDFNPDAKDEEISELKSKLASANALLAVDAQIIEMLQDASDRGDVYLERLRRADNALEDLRDFYPSDPTIKKYMEGRDWA
jgi:hypothetical protein